MIRALRSSFTALAIVTAALGGCVETDATDDLPTSSPPPPPSLESKSSDDDGTSSYRTPVTFTCTMTCYYNQWECQNTCDGSDGSWCISHTTWQGDGWSAWSPYTCTR